MGNGFAGIQGTPLIIPSWTWATKPGGSYVGQLISLSDYDNALFQWDGTRWLPHDFQQLLHRNTVPRPIFTGATEQVMMQLAIPAGFLHVGGTLSPICMISKSAAVETATVRVRFGPTGTIADTLLVTATGITTDTILNVGNMHFGFMKTDAIDLRAIWNGIAGGWDVVVTNMDTTDCFLSMTVQLSVGAETVYLEQAQILYY